MLLDGLVEGGWVVEQPNHTEIVACDHELLIVRPTYCSHIVPLTIRIYLHININKYISPTLGTHKRMSM